MLEVLFTKKISDPKTTKIVLMFEGEAISASCFTEEDAKFVQKAIKQSCFDGKKGEFVTVFGGRSKILLVGMGKEKNLLSIQQIGELLFQKLFSEEQAYIITPSDEFALNLAYGVVLGSYSFDKYKTEKKAEDFPKLERIVLQAKDPDKAYETFKSYTAVATAVRYCKDLCNEPANYLTPQVFADDIKRLEYLGLDVEILDEKKIALKGLNLVEAVGKGGAHKPRVVIVTWKGNREQKSYDLGLVGKGVCFDAGGLSLKSNTGMVEMKMDMSGAAAVVAAMKAVALQRVRKNLVAIVGLVENMPDGDAMKIGDVYSSYNGKTVEIMNTDAEGRLVVADCLAYLQKNYPVKKIVDLATLGSLKNVLGDVYAGLFSNDIKLADTMLKAGERSGEKLWAMPLSEAYEKMLTSPIADIRNVALDGKASIVSAAFLNKFIKKDVKWAHVDISGCRLDNQKMASGFGVKLLNELIKGL